MSAPQPTPWSEHRMLAETIGQAVADSLTGLVGSHVDLGKSAAFDPETMLDGRPMPLRGFVVRFHRPLRDVAIFLTSHKDDVIRPVVERAAQAIVASVDVPGEPDQHGPLGGWEVEELAELDELQVALEQCDALFLEATYALDLPNGELRMVLGTGLLESASCFVEGIVDPFAEEPLVVPASAELELGDAIGLDEAARYELGDEIGGFDAADDVLVPAPVAAAASTSSIDDYDAMLAAQEQAEAEAAAAVAAATAATATANVEAATLPELGDDAATQRWTQLLSGVEVELSAELGRAELALGDITSLASDSVLTLDQLVHEPVTVFVNGTPYATARLVVVDGEYGIEILTVVEQQAPLVASLAAA